MKVTPVIGKQTCPVNTPHLSKTSLHANATRMMMRGDGASTGMAQSPAQNP